MALTYQDTVSNGIQTDYNIIFPFLDRDHVEVKFSGVAQPSSSFSFLSDSQIRLTTPASNTTVVRVGRNTPKTILTDFVGAGTILPEADLDNGYLHNLYMAQELQDLYDESIAGAISVQITPLNNLTATVPPSVTDDSGDGYSVGSFWFNAADKVTYRASDVTVGAAVWNVVGTRGNVAATAPGVTNDSSEGYHISSHWWDTSTGAIYICTDPTEGAAVWGSLAPSTLSYPLTHTGLVHDKESSGLASAATVDLSTATGNYVTVSGSIGPITSFGTLPAGTEMEIYFTGNPTITAHATQIICPLNLDIIVQPGDVLRLRSEGTNSWRVVGYLRAAIPAGTPYPPGYIHLFTIGNGTDSLNDINIAAGACVDSLGLVNMINSTSVVTKQIDAVWAEGSAAGGFPSGLTSGSPVDGTWYRVFVIRRPDTGLLDFGFDTSSSAANLLADASNYTAYRRIGWVYYDSSLSHAGIQLFTQIYEDFYWTDPVWTMLTNPADGNTTVFAPPVSEAKMQAAMDKNNTLGIEYIIMRPTFTTYTGTAIRISSGSMFATGANNESTVHNVITDFSRQINLTTVNNAVNSNAYVHTLGWKDYRKD